MQLNPREHFLFGAQVVRNASTLHHHTDLYVLTGHKGFIDRVAVVEQDRHLAEYGVHLPQPLGLRQQHIRFVSLIVLLITLVISWQLTMSYSTPLALRQRTVRWA